ncbi:MAG: Gx transporter family protein [Clostridia bacterium]|nr:Gx transporter family protein [Clostridia bacterium]
MKKRMKTKTVTTMGLLTAVALILGYVEHLIPISPIPGIKLGLGNIVLLYGLCLLTPGQTWMLLFLKVGLSGLLFGGVSAMAYSFAGGILSLICMQAMKRIPGFSLIGVSVVGAAMHNVGQIVLACLLVESRAVLSYLPVLLVSAAVTGALTGMAAQLTIRGIEKAGLNRHKTF